MNIYVPHVDCSSLPAVLGAWLNLKTVWSNEINVSRGSLSASKVLNSPHMRVLDKHYKSDLLSYFLDATLQSKKSVSSFIFKV